MSKLRIQKVPSVEERKLPIFAELDELAEKIRVRAFNLFAGRGFEEGSDVDDWLTAEREICWPATELDEEDDEIEVKVALAGFEPEDIEITASPRELIVKASHKEERTKPESGEGKGTHWSEFRSNEVYRRVPLPADIDVAKVSAEFKRGMLEIEAPKRKKKKAARKKIKVSPAK